MGKLSWVFVAAIGCIVLAVTVWLLAVPTYAGIENCGSVLTPLGRYTSAGSAISTTPECDAVHREFAAYAAGVVVGGGLVVLLLVVAARRKRPPVELSAVPGPPVMMASVTAPAAHARGSGTTLAQFRNALENDYARSILGVELTAADAEFVASDPQLSEAFYRRWLATQATQFKRAPTAPAVQSAAPLASQPYIARTAPERVNTGREAGFTCSLIASLFIPLPIVCLPLGIIGWVKSSGALRRIPVGTPGRGLANAGLVLGIVATTLTSLLMVAAIPGALLHNFG